MNKPLVSVVIPFYSGKDWLIEAIESALSQTYQNKEIIVINDGSNENIEDIIKEYKKCIKVFNKKNGGPASARNLGIGLSKGKYVAFLDSDDKWLPEKLEKQIDFMETKGYVWSHHSYEMFWENRKKRKIIDTSIYNGNVYKDCFISFKVQTSCVVVQKSALQEHNIIFPEEKRYGQDGTFYKQLAKYFPLGYVDGVYSRFRIRGSNAGFRARVQINNRSLLWNDIRNNKEILKMLPYPVIFAYFLSFKFNNLINNLEKKIIKKEILIEYTSKFLYILPYILFKLYAK